MLIKAKYQAHIAALLIIFSVLVIPSYGRGEPLSSAAAVSQNTDEHNTASTDPADGHSSDRRGDYIDLLYRFLNFTALAVILVIVFRKARISHYFSARSEEIAKEMEDLKRDRDEVEKRYKEVEEQVKKIEKKCMEIIEQYQKEGETEKERIISEAREKVKQILGQAESTIQREVESATGELKQEILEKASQRARDILMHEIGDREQDNMVYEFMEKMGRMK